MKIKKKDLNLNAHAIVADGSGKKTNREFDKGDGSGKKKKRRNGKQNEHDVCQTFREMKWKGYFNRNSLFE